MTIESEEIAVQILGPQGAARRPVLLNNASGSRTRSTHWKTKGDQALIFPVASD
jgi:hypothetical protein